MEVSTVFSFLVESAFKATVLLVAAWTVTFLLRSRSAALRHLIWSIAFAAVLVIPLISNALPTIAVPLSQSSRVSDFLFQTTVHAAWRVPGAAAFTIATPNVLTFNWPLVLTLLWIVGVVFSLTQMFVGWLSINRLRRNGKAFGAAKLSLKADQDIDLIETPSGTMPMAYGILRPTIFLPVDANLWSPDRRRMVMSHELAHIQRRDVSTNLLARTVVRCYWWNPIVWLAWREFLKQRERAADDLVLSAGEASSDYASHLLEIARQLQVPLAFRWSAVAMASRSQLEGRLLAILDTKQKRNPPKRLSFYTALIAAALVVGPLAALQARPGQSNSDRQSNLPAGVSDLIQSGDRLADDAKYGPAKSAYSKALSLAPESALALIHRGVVELSTKDYPAATSDFEQAQKVDSTYIAQSKMWQALAQQQEQHFAAAKSLYESALRAAGSRTDTAATIMELYAQTLQQQGFVQEATRLRSEAYEIREDDAKKAPPAGGQSATEVFRAGKDVSSPVLLSKIEPQYSAEATVAKYQGVVLLKVEIGSDGKTQNIRVIRSLGLGLDQKAIEAVSKWKFKPGTKDGKPVVVAATIEVNFKLT